MSYTPLTILVVEDDPIIGLDLKGTLQSVGYKVVGPVVSGEEAIQVAAEVSPDLMLMDINLRGELDGIDTVKEIAKKQSIPTIFLTANSDEKTLQRAMLTIPFGYLIKPFDPFELRSSIEVAIQRSRLVTTEDPLEEEEKKEEMAAQAVESDDQILAFLRSIPAFRSVPGDVLGELASRATLRVLEANETLVSPEDDSPVGFVPISGRISITKTSRAGKELVVSLVGTSDIFGLFYGLESFRGTSWAQTQVPSKVISIPGNTLRKLLQESQALSLAVNEALARRLVHAHELSTSLAHSGVEDRITAMLTALLHDFGKDSGRGDSGRIFITRRELADLVGTTPETAIRITKNLEREGLLDLTKPGIIKVPNVKTLVEWMEEKAASEK